MTSFKQPSEIERGLATAKALHSMLALSIPDIELLPEELQSNLISGVALMTCEAYIWAEYAGELPKANDFDDLRERTAAFHTLILDDYKKIRG